MTGRSFFGSRRHFFKLGAQVGGVGLGAGLTHLLPFRSMVPAEEVALGQEQAGTPPHRFLQIFLLGGWDSALATDPIVGSKLSSGNYESIYNSYEVTSVPDKANLRVGIGLKPAINAFAALPSAFVNGIFVEVTAHDLATKYVFSGTLSLSRSREYPAFIARVGEAAAGFPSHVLLGNSMPLGDTKLTSPPIWAGDASMLANLFQGPYNPWFSDEMVDRAGLLTALNNKRFYERLSAKAQASLQPWVNANRDISSLYGGNYREKLTLTEAVQSRYHVTDGNWWHPEALMASTFLLLKSGLSPYITAAFGSYDTHTSHIANHLPEMNRFAENLNTLIGDMRETPDPADGNLSLADTTTILITSEFVRTPRFNNGAGTDHWPSCSCILMGKGVKDNTVLGGTDDQAVALGWDEGQLVTRVPENTLLPDHLVAAIVQHLGFPTVANAISEKPLGGLFES